MGQIDCSRRLAAILVADVVGYSKSMSEDEAATHSALKRQRSSIVDPAVEAHGGRVIKSTGDGILAEFASVSAAVNCAIELQRQLAAGENAGQQLRWRMGVNFGEVIVEDGDIFGDCVNIAARLEGLAEPGGICVSEKVFREVRALVGATFESIGSQKLKNIVEPIHVYRSSFELSRREELEPLTGAARPARLRARPSVVVLPFLNLTPENRNAHLAHGLTEELIYDLSMSPEFFVIDRVSSFAIGSERANVRQVTSQLGVRYVVSGSLEQSGDRIKVTAELIDGETGLQLWSGRFNRENPYLLDTRDEIARSIAATLMTSSGQIAKAELRRQLSVPPREFTIYDHYLRAREAFHRSLQPPWEEGRRWSKIAAERFRKTIALSDPPYWPAVAALAWQHAIDFDFEYADDDGEAGRLAFEHASQAVRNAPELHLGQWALGWAYLIVRHDHERAEFHYNLARELNVGDGRLVAEMAQLFIYTGRYEQAIMNLRQAIRLNPYHEQWYDDFLGWAYEENGEPDKAIEVLTRLPELEAVWSYMVLARSYLQLGNREKTLESLAIMDRLAQRKTGRAFDLPMWIDWVKRKEPYQDPARAGRVIGLARQVLELAGRAPAQSTQTVQGD
jgi:adenylate cyclase